jgi:excisionase family DNA binding protein
MGKDLDKLWTMKDLASYLKVKESVIGYWVRCRKIPHIRIGRMIRFLPAEIQTWIHDHQCNVFLSHKPLRRIE